MEPVVSAEGWGVLHLFARPRPGGDGEAVAAAVKACQGDDHQVVPFAVLGHKGTLGFMALGPDLWRLQRLQSELEVAGLDLVTSYVSMTESPSTPRGCRPSGWSRGSTPACRYTPPGRSWRKRRRGGRWGIGGGRRGSSSSYSPWLSLLSFSSSIDTASGARPASCRSEPYSC